MSQIHQTPSTSLSRREKILEMLGKHGFVSILDLRDSLDVSESTIRRDLESLEEAGEAKRTHGGVFSTGANTVVQQFHSMKENWDQKKAIAAAAAELVGEHETILLGGGSTVYELARLLVRRSLQIVTNSLPIASLFASNGMVDLVFLGGFVHHRTGLTIGPFAIDMLKTLNVQKAFLSVAGISEKGFFNSNALSVETEKAMMNCADRTIILADSSKFGRSSLARLCPWSEVRLLISDNQLGKQWIDLAASAGTSTKIVSAPHEESKQPSKELTSKRTASIGSASQGGSV
jgi:DeoR family transcriptional regulator, fructose operon transcriptional repressor